MQYIPDMRTVERRRFDMRGFAFTAISLVPVLCGLDRFAAALSSWHVPFAQLVRRQKHQRQLFVVEIQK